MDIVVLDTNVLLVDPDALTSYPGKEIVLPEIVLSELDKIKIARTDAETRYRGRELSRNIFELSDGRPLTEGIELEGGGMLRIIPFNTELPMPEGFSAKNPDDRIIVTAQRLSEQEKDRETVLVTNDLNMLLKAQQLEVHIERHDGGDESAFMKRYVVRPFQKYRTPFLILVVAIAMFAATVVVAVNMNIKNSESGLPSEYRNFLTDEQASGIDALIKLQSDPRDAESLLTVAKLYYEYYQNAAQQSSADALTYAKKGISYYTRYIDVNSADVEAYVELGALQLYSGDIDGASSSLETALSDNPDNINANYTMGLIAMQGKHDYDLADTCFQKTVDLCGDDIGNDTIKQSATSYLQQIKTKDENLNNPESGGASA